MTNEKAFLNSIILEVIKTYPTNGVYTYWWKDGFDGVTYDIKYKGEVVAKSEEQKRTYCCGITFEAYLTACERFAKLNGKDKYTLGNLDPWGVRKMKSDWFIATGIKTSPSGFIYPLNKNNVPRSGGVLDALVTRGLGIEVKPGDAQPGDFLQLWRESGSGHSTIFLRYENDRIKYWSTQRSTDGIGIQTEGKHRELYFARAFVPTI